MFLVRERGVVVSMTCGSAQCTEASQMTKLAKLVESRLPELPQETPTQSETGPEPAGDADGKPAQEPTP